MWRVTPHSSSSLSFMWKLLRSSIISRHDRLMQCLARIARHSGTAVEIEPHLAAGDEGSRADGKFYFISLPAFVDSSVVHPAAPSYLNVASTPLATTAKRERDKNNSYLYFAQSEGAQFYPFVLETFGAIGPRGLDFVSRLSEEAISNGLTTLENQKIKTFILRSISFTLQSGNANIMINGARLSRAKSNRVNE